MRGGINVFLRVPAPAGVEWCLVSGDKQSGKLGGGQAAHLPVLLREVLNALAPLEGAHVVDGTFGAGGYSRALLEAGAHVTAIDRDPNVRPFADRLNAEFPNHFRFVEGRFSALDELAEPPVDAVVLDIGVSSMQLDEAERGFSFLRDGPLDMRMGGEGPSAADLVNRLGEKELASLLFALGEERKSRRIAAAIVLARAGTPIATTGQLARLIEETIGRHKGENHPATRSFQALRIAVNSEFEELVTALFAAESLLGEGGRLAVVTFHSLEDRIVKRFLATDKNASGGSRHAPPLERPEARWTGISRPVKSSDAEREINPRARSATLRTASRTGVPARPRSPAGLGVPGYSLRGVA